MNSKNKKMLGDDIIAVQLLMGKNMDNNPVYAYIAIHGNKLEAFREALSRGNFNPADFGVIIESGTGTPPDEVKKKMENEYGFDHSSPLVCATES